MDNLTDEIKILVARITKIPADKIDPDADLFADLGVDSILGVEILAALDKKYGIVIPEEKLRDINSVRDLAKDISARITSPKIRR